MKLEELIPLPKDKVHFKLASFKFVPKETGCYVLTSFENDILYIGLSENLNYRFKQHIDNPEKTNPTKEGKAVWFHFSTYDFKDLTSIERTWIHQFAAMHGRLPILNKVNSPLI
ncbi:MAG: GIY-YIG nuclease family protein [Candidatus Methanoperedens sp.]|nr:GIY-YIG nuclease family protein [Candidatus Methanoperedens sp.]